MLITELASIRGITSVVPRRVISRDAHYGAGRAIPGLVTNHGPVRGLTIIMSPRVIPGEAMRGAIGSKPILVA